MNYSQNWPFNWSCQQKRFFESTCATWTVGSYVSLSVRPSVCLWLDQNYWTIFISRIIHISDDPEVELKGQGHRSRSPGQKRYHMGQGQRSLRSRSKVTGVKVSQALKIMVDGLTSTSNCFIFWILLWHAKPYRLMEWMRWHCTTPIEVECGFSVGIAAVQHWT